MTVTTRITRRYLEGKTKSDLAQMYLDLLDISEKERLQLPTKAEAELCEAALVWFLTPEVLDDYEALKDTESASAPAEFMLLCEVARDVLDERKNMKRIKDFPKMSREAMDALVKKAAEEGF